MEKTKFGVSAGLLSMICYFTGYTSLPASLLMLVLALVWSESVTLKKNACQATVLSIFFSLIFTVLNWISGAYESLLNMIFGLFDELLDVSEVQQWFIDNNGFDFLIGFLGFAEFVLMIVFVILSLKNKVVKIPLITKLIDKHFDAEETVETPAAEETVASSVVAKTVVADAPVEEKPKKTTRRTTKKAVQAETAEENKTE